MAQIACIAKLTAQPGQRAELAAVCQRLVEGTESEPGTLIYTLHEDSGADDVLWFYELYTDDAALTAHSQSPIMAEVGPILMPLLADRPELHFCRPLAGKGH